MERRISSDWRDVQLSPNFKAGEFVVSSKHPALAAQITPTIEQFNNFYLLANLVLQPVRDHYGPVHITSGLVSAELNAARTPSPLEDSQHLYGEAVDFILRRAGATTVFLWIQNVLKWKGELLLYSGSQHIHVGLPSPWVKADHKVVS